jgi:hypothetical protein
MIKEFRYRVKVPTQIKTLPRSQRVAPALKKGEKYYISFGNNWAYPCFIYEVVQEFERTEVRVKIKVKEQYAYFRQNGKMTYDPYEEHLVYANEIGITPEDAVRNSV